MEKIFSGDVIMTKIKKIVVYFEDGTYEELNGNTAAVWPPSIFNKQPCLNCGGFHGDGMMCPKLQPYSSGNPIPVIKYSTKTEGL